MTADVRDVADRIREVVEEEHAELAQERAHEHVAERFRNAVATSHDAES